MMIQHHQRVRAVLRHRFNHDSAIVQQRRAPFRVRREKCIHRLARRARRIHVPRRRLRRNRQERFARIVQCRSNRSRIHAEEIVLAGQLRVLGQIRRRVQRLRMALRHIKLMHALAGGQQLVYRHALAIGQGREIGCEMQALRPLQDGIGARRVPAWRDASR